MVGQPALLRRVAWACLLLSLLAGPARAADAPAASGATQKAPAPGTTEPPAPPAAAPTTSALLSTGAVPDAEIPERAEETSQRLRRVVQQLESSVDLESVEAEVKEAGDRTSSGAALTREALRRATGPGVIVDLTNAWKEAREQTSARATTLEHAQQACDAGLEEIDALDHAWAETADAATGRGSAAYLRTSIDEARAEVRQARDHASALRDRVVLLREETGRQISICDESLRLLERTEALRVGGLGRRVVGPLWDTVRAPGAFADGSARISEDNDTELRISAAFLRRHPSFAPLLIVTFAVLALLFRRIHQNVSRWTGTSALAEPHLAVLDLPYSVALLLTVFVAFLLNQEVPSTIFTLFGLSAVISLLRILDRYAHPVFMRSIWVIVGLRGVSYLLDFSSASPFFEQILSCVTTAAGFFLVLWATSATYLRGASQSRAVAPWLPTVRWLALLLALGLAAAFVAAVLGYLHLAHTLSEMPIFTLAAGITLYAVARVLSGLWTLLLFTPALSTLRMVQKDRETLVRLGAVILGWLSFAAWLLVMRRNLAFVGLTMGGLQRLLSASATFGSITLSAGDLIAFGITVWASFVVSRGTRFVLNEELFPRLSLAPGVPYALSSLVNYAILLAGMVLALATLGFDASRLTVVIGALGVGIGFGLQEIVNNFVSGLILLFERPVKVGDSVQVGAISGEVRRIGIRSSTIRTGSGAEVIVPNSSLISQTVTNWTLSDRSRRFELTLSVPLGPDPDHVLQVLRETAKQHPEVLAHPEPAALIVGFEEKSLAFEIRAWVADGGRAAVVKSAVAAAIARALETEGIQAPGSE